MRQLLQNLKSGELQIAETPAPAARPGTLLIRTRLSLISAGTERMLVDFARSNLVAKARKQPDRVQQVLDKVRSEGLWATYQAVQARLDEPLPLGYCNCGTVLAVGEGGGDIDVGCRVASNGPHAEIVCVPRNLCARVPDEVSDDRAVFTVVSAIGLQGIRLLAPTLGETIVVFGLGLIGLLAVQLLRVHGCRVIGIDPDPQRCELAAGWGAQTIRPVEGVDPVQRARVLTGDRGVDGVLIAAAAKKDRIVREAARMCRRRGRIVLVGVVDLHLDRADFYEKELTFQVSCAYGPGRYDEAYELGRDYPYGLVRWTEQRNLSAVLDCMADGRLDPTALIDRRVPLAEAAQAYDELAAGRAPLATLLTYPAEPDAGRVVRVAAAPPRTASAAGQVVLGVLGAGTFVKRTLGPALKGLDARCKTIVAPSGVSAADAAKKFGFEQAASEEDAVLADAEINAVIIATRHDAHGRQVKAALRAGKHVLVEKPLCLTVQELEEIRAELETSTGHLLVGFNRRFAPLAARAREMLAGRAEPLCVHALVNAGHVPAESWLHDPRVGGGRIVGEGCHWIDLMRFLTGAPIHAVSAARAGGRGAAPAFDDRTTITLEFADGSLGTLLYLANGHRSYPKETIEVFCEGRVLRLENFRRLRGFGWEGLRGPRTLQPEKGHREQLRVFCERIRAGGEPLVPFEEIENVTRASLAAAQAAGAEGRVTLP